MTSICEQIKTEKIDTFKNSILDFRKSDILAQINSLEKQKVLVSLIAENPNEHEEMVLLCESYFDSVLQNSIVKEYISSFIALIAPTLGVYIGAAYGLAISTNDKQELTLMSSLLTIIVLGILFVVLIKARRDEREFEFYFRLFLKNLKSCKDPSFEE